MPIVGAFGCEHGSAWIPCPYTTNCKAHFFLCFRHIAFEDNMPTWCLKYPTHCQMPLEQGNWSFTCDRSLTRQWSKSYGWSVFTTLTIIDCFVDIFFLCWLFVAISSILQIVSQLLKLHPTHPASAVVCLQWNPWAATKTVDWQQVLEGAVNMQRCTHSLGSWETWCNVPCAVEKNQLKSDYLH